jgi:hypothetical protein
MVQSVAMKRLKITLQLIGISLAIVGWYFQKAERYEWVVRVFAPSYTRTLTAYERMLLSAPPSGAGTPVVLTKSAPGFQELLSILRHHVPEIGNEVSVESMRITSVGSSTGYNAKTGVSYTGARPIFEIQFTDGKIVTKFLEDHRPEIRKRFLDDTLFMWSSWIFWTGIVINFSSALIRS